MDLAIERARASGNALMLISGDARLYLARGATRITNVYRVRLDPAVLSGVSTAGVRAVRAEDLDAIVKLNATRAERYVWKPSDVATWHDAHMRLGGRAWVRDRGGSIDGGLWVHHQPPAESRAGFGQVVEMLGKPESIRSLFAAAIRELGLASLEVKVLHAETARRRMLDELGLACSAAPSDWTVKVLDLPAVIDVTNAQSTQPTAVALRAERDVLVLVTGNEAIRVTETNAINAILFNEPDAWPEEVQRLDASAKAELARTVPLPLCSYGLNYI